ncbi:gag-pol polyprotein [Cucumis melo var. makuwa]|uniref:Gag-pol polyprotein n=1 Tax=Cucumis melo var. makuwa TaxID=1194695 RepID=A0A5D3BL69_CUCMM|nr:gag-pol polyprotein [Cucumis melo var. makuwa]TYJ99774.1 gag-pol polyprotein [Cucumis melo var. makuwa]
MGSQRNNREGQTIRQPRILDTSSSVLYRKKEHEREKGIGISRPDKYGKGIRGHECEGFGHIQSECATYLKCKKKGLVATFSNEEDYSESDDEEIGMALISICTMNDEEAAKMLTNETLKLDDILDQGRRVDDKRGLDFVERGAPVRTTVFSREGIIQNSSTIINREELLKILAYFEILEQANTHMTGNADFFSELSECKAESVVFGDGGKGKIIGKGTINRPGYQVSFSKDRCNVLDSQNKVFLSGTRLSDNCYHWDVEVNLCNLSKVEEAGLWHKWLGHLSGTTISKVTKADAIIGLPSLTFFSLESCLECPAGIFHEFSAPLTPQQNGVVERRNRTLQEMARVMIHAKQLSIQFWAEALNTTCHIHNRVILRSRTTTTSYELWKGRKPNVKYFHIFGSTCFILSDRDHRRKWNSKSDRGIFLGYSTNSRAYRVYNQGTKIAMESVNVIIDDLGKAPNRNLDEEDEAFWDSLSHKTADA